MTIPGESAHSPDVQVTGAFREGPGRMPMAQGRAAHSVQGVKEGSHL